MLDGLFLQLARAGFLLLLGIFVWLVMRTLVADVHAASGFPTPLRIPRVSYRALRNSQFPRNARYLVVTQGPLANTRITLGAQPVLMGRANDSTLVLTDDYASTRHAKLSQQGDNWYLEDLGSTNGTYLDNTKVVSSVKVPLYTPIRIGKTVIELQP